MVKKSICCINNGNTILWETKDIQEQRQERTGVRIDLSIHCRRSNFLLDLI